ncbi:MAG TPA: hypothetical protein VMU41_12135 [Candidatus Binataceae bacterium]|nr:hypothetical protein [Candidatus Binataceae bacterium]
MGSVVQLARRRAVASKPKAKSAREAEESRRSLVVLVGTFTLTAVAMSVAVVVAGSDSWAEAVPMTLCVVVFALLKVVLADAAFFGMLKADQLSEKKEAAARQKLATAPGSILRRPPLNPRGRVLAATSLAALPQPRRGRLALVIRRHPNGRGNSKR